MGSKEANLLTQMSIIRHMCSPSLPSLSFASGSTDSSWMSKKSNRRVPEHITLQSLLLKNRVFLDQLMFTIHKSAMYVNQYMQSSSSRARDQDSISARADDVTRRQSIALAGLRLVSECLHIFGRLLHLAIADWNSV